MNAIFSYLKRAADRAGMPLKGLILIAVMVGFALGFFFVLEYEAAIGILVATLVAISFSILKPKYWYLLLLVVLPLITFIDIHEGPFGAGNIARTVIVFVAFYFFLINVLKGIQYKLVSNPVNLPLLAYFTLGATYVFFNSAAMDIGAASFFEHCLYILLYFIVANTIFEKGQIKMSYLFILGGSLVVSVGGIAAFYFIYRQGVAGIVRTESFFGYVNLLGVYLAVINALCIGRLFYAESKSERRAIGLILSLGLSALVLTFSIRSWVTLGIATIIMAILSNKHKMAIITAMSIVIAASFMVINTNSDNNGSGALALLGRVQRSMEGRSMEYTPAYEKIAEAPVLGHGLGYSGTVSSALNPSGSLYVHNYYLQVLIEMGVIGLLIYSWFIIASIIMAVRAFRRAKDGLLRSFTLSTAAAMVIIGLSGFVGTSNSAFPINYYLCFMLGVTAAIYSKADKIQAKTDRIEAKL